MLVAKTSRYSIALTLLVSLACLAVPAAAQGDVQLQKLNPILRAALNDAPLASGTFRPFGTSSTPVAGYDVFIRGPVSIGELQALGVEVRTDLGDIKTAFVPETALAAVSNLTAVQRIEGSVEVEQELDVSVPATGAAALRGPAPTFTGLNGAGVFVGDIDSGVDWTHEDFDDPAGNTRIQYIWDQTDALGPNPGGFAYGSEWTAADIDANLPRQKDTDGHGSHVLAIAGGDGSKTGNAQPAYQYVGMAPNADLVMVKTNFLTTGIVDGVNYFYQRAAGAPAVCNISLGSHYGPHDGTSTFEQALAALTGHGKLLIKSAGNERNSNYHAQTNAVGAPGAPARLNISVGGAGTTAIDGYYTMGDNISITLQTPNGTILGPVAKGATIFQTVAGQGRVYIENAVTPTNSGDHEIYIQIDSGGGPLVASGNWLFRFISVAIPSGGEVDLWRFAHTIPSSSASFNLAQQNDELVSEPGNSDSLCTVASWTTRRNWTAIDGNSYVFTGAVLPGNLSPYSSPGPTRDGRQKPNIAAPGSAIGSARSVDAVFSVPLVLPDGVHAILQGTSMAAPHVTGAAALIMQARGKMWPSQFCQFLATTALSDPQTGATPNNSWGYGKLSLNAATAIALSHFEIDYGDNAVQLAWGFVEGIMVTNLRAERRIGSQGEFSPLAAPIEEILENGVRSYRLVDSQVLAGLTYEYQVLGLNSLGEVVTFGPFVAQIPQPTALAWALAAPAPNPARLGKVQFVYSAATRGEASMVVYDARGREVARPLSGTVEPGTHTLNWAGTSRSGQRLAPGIYLVVFRGGQQDFRQKLVLLD